MLFLVSLRLCLVSFGRCFVLSCLALFLLVWVCLCLVLSWLCLVCLCRLCPFFVLSLLCLVLSCLCFGCCVRLLLFLCSSLFCLVLFWSSSGSFGVIFGRHRGRFGSFLVVFGVVLALLGRSWRALEALETVLGRVDASRGGPPDLRTALGSVFGPILGAKRGPRRSQKRPKIDQKIVLKNDRVLDRS